MHITAFDGLLVSEASASRDWVFSSETQVINLRQSSGRHCPPTMSASDEIIWTAICRLMRLIKVLFCDVYAVISDSLWPPWLPVTFTLAGYKMFITTPIVV